MQYLHIGAVMVFRIMQECDSNGIFSFGKLRDIQINRQSLSCAILTIGIGSFLFIYYFLICSITSEK